MRTLTVIFSFFLIPLSLSSQTELPDSAFLTEIDSLIAEYDRRQNEEKVVQVINDYNRQMLKREMSFRTDGAYHLVRGLTLSWTDHHFIAHKAQFPSKGDACNWPDYGVASVPLVANWILKASGVESRSKVQRMLTANAMALAFSFGTTQLLRGVIDESRPDRSNPNSFPSGHTSFAFVAASILSREYGYLSPWVTVGGYTTATATQLLRIGHNKHWINDIYVGAGIGVMSTNLGYFLTDKILGEKAINSPALRRKDLDRVLQFNERASGFSFMSGTEVGDRTIHFGDATVKTGASFSSGADLSWFFKPQFALELMTRMVDAQAKVFDGDKVYPGGHINLYHFDLAGKYSMPFVLGKRFSSRVFLGARVMDGDTFLHSTHTLQIPNETKFEFGMGLGYEHIDKDNYAVGFAFDYYHTFSDYMKNRYGISTVWKILF
ncbi:MAG: phosphatase PAP2 family protein [Bacteroidales bacterium]|nr:phosphatase PAP2 family protein [Bacteroidales bacterium]